MYIYMYTCLSADFVGSKFYVGLKLCNFSEGFLEIDYF